MKLSPKRKHTSIHKIFPADVLENVLSPPAIPTSSMTCFAL